MEGLFAVLLIIICIVAAFFCILLLGYYLINLFLDLSLKPGNIRKMKDFPGSMFTAHSRASEEAFRKISPLFEYWESTDETELPVKTGRELSDRINSSRRILSENKIIRRIRFLDLAAETRKNGSLCRRWNDGGKEWQAYELTGAMLESYTDREGKELIEPRYFPTAKVIFTMSRRLRAEESAIFGAKDKWGRKISGQKNFYEDMQLKNCPSCGAALSTNLKDTVCHSCGSTIFSDYYDWQIESIETEPMTTAEATADIFRNRRPGQQVSGNKTKKKKKSKNKIVRFSENDFRKDVTEACMAETGGNDLIDIFLGNLKIKHIRNTETQTFLSIKVPVYRTVIDKNKKITFTKENMKAVFVRARYPRKFDRKTAVISEEKQCRNCGGPYSPDENGNCPYCGSFLFRDNLKWEKVSGR